MEIEFPRVFSAEDRNDDPFPIQQKWMNVLMEYGLQFNITSTHRSLRMNEANAGNFSKLMLDRLSMSIVSCKVSSIIRLIRNLYFFAYPNVWIQSPIWIYYIAFIMINKHYDKNGIEKKVCRVNIYFSLI